MKKSTSKSSNVTLLEERSESVYSPTSASGGGSSKGSGGNKWYLHDRQLLEIMTVDEIEEFKGLFDMFDIDGSGDISVKELQTIMR